ncbi:MAG: hypothetical protein WDN23_15825 [Edaphobacter sp.]
MSFSGLGLEAVAVGVHVDRTHTKWHDDPAQGELVQDCSVHRLAGSVFAEGRDIAFVVDWLENLDCVFIWPDTIKTSSNNESTVTLGTGTGSITIRGSSGPEGSRRQCVRLVIDGQNLFVCCAEKSKADRHSKRGYIVYEGNPSADFRDRVRRCLSFALGLYLVYLGYTAFDSQWATVQFEAVSAYSLSGRAFDLGPMPPAPLGTRYEWEVDPAMLSRSANALFAEYKNLNFGVVSWAYWHAAAAAPHIAGAHYGAAIQSLERAFLKTTKSKVNRTLLPKTDWEILKVEFENVLAAKDISPDVAQILNNKLKHFNEAPQSEVTDALLAQLGLRFGERENHAASKVRNKSAHGKDDEVDVEWIRDLKLARIRFNRMIFAMTGASDWYYDYFTLGRPTRPLVEASSDPI